MSLFLTHSLMAEGPDYLKLFESKRLVPGVHDRLIERYLKYFEGTDKYSEYAEHYVAKTPAAPAKKEPVAEAPAPKAEKKPVKKPTPAKNA